MSKNKNDKVIAQYQAKVEARRKSLGAQPKVQYVTNALFPSAQGKVNLNALTDVAQYVDLIQFIFLSTSTHELACEAMEVTEDLTFGSYASEEWIQDIRSRKDLLVWNEGKKELTAADKKLAALLSNEAKTANAISDIVGSLDI